MENSQLENSYYPCKSRLSYILILFLNFRSSEPGYSYRRDSYKKKSVYFCSVKLASVCSVYGNVAMVTDLQSDFLLLDNPIRTLAELFATNRHVCRDKFTNETVQL